MKADEVRLECLKLAHAQGRETAQVIERATEYARFVSSSAVPPAERSGTDGAATGTEKPNAGNVDPLE